MSKRKNSRQKGASGEREWGHYLAAQNLSARRGVQFQGGPDSPDVVCGDLPNLHAEVKRVERGLCLYQATDQAAEEAPPEKRPYVAHRKNRKEWLVTMRAADWVYLATKAQIHDPGAVVRLLVVEWPVAAFGHEGQPNACALRPVLVAASVAGDACLIHEVVDGESSGHVDLGTISTAERLSLYEATKKAWRDRGASLPAVAALRETLSPGKEGPALVDDLSGGPQIEVLP